VKIQAGVLSHAPLWEEVFRQEGIPFTVVDLQKADPVETISVLVVNRPLPDSEREIVAHYLRSGGAVLGYARDLAGVAGITRRSERMDYVVSDRDDAFRGISLLDTGITGEIPREANVLRTHQNTFAAFAGPLGGGHAVVLPFDCERLLADDRVAGKNFYASPDRLPSEHVSLVAKGELRQLLHRSFEYLHHVRGIPYAHLWWFPEGKRNVFAFRIDSDGAPRGEVDELYAIARRHGIRMSWFLDVKSHEAWLGHFGSMVDQEMGVHCYEHVVYPSYGENLRNVMKAKRLMEAAGLQASGFAAPLGAWNPPLAKALEELEFSYSSEFSYAYDTLPLHPWRGTAGYATLQVPVHPICIGSMRKVGYSEQQMTHYFRMVVEQKLIRNEPLFFYHHPTHRHGNVVGNLFAWMEEMNIDSMTLGEYAAWWKERSKVKPCIEIREGRFSFSDDGAMQTASRGGICFHVTNDHGEEAFLPLSEGVDPAGVKWSTCPTYAPPADIRRVRDFDPRGLLAEVYEVMIRKLR